jgi:hypothetical protein
MEFLFRAIYANTISKREEERMRKAEDFSDLKLPEKHMIFLRHFINNLSSVENVDRLILFGSCARGTFRPDSDIDLFIVTKTELTQEDEIYIYCDCPPIYNEQLYVDPDIIIQIADKYDKFKYEPGMVQKYVELDGIDLTGLLRKCRRQ